MRRLYLFAAVLIVTTGVPAAASAQEPGSIRGQVIDGETGAPVVGAQVSVTGTEFGTLTNQQGRFLLVGVPGGTQTVSVTFLGYGEATREVVVGESTAVDFELARDILRLDELVVVGYGTQRRRNVTGAISSLNPESVVEQASIATVDNLLQGRTPGVHVVQNSGNPGAAISVRIRGASSISAGNQPLYVIDGVPLTQGSFSEINDMFGGQDIDALADLDPNQIESIEVLKDASAAAIFGSRASNGVVLITTKRGVPARRPRITFNAYYGTQSNWKTIDLLNTDQYFDVYNEAFGGPVFGYTDDGVDNEFEIEPGTNTNWLEEVFRPAPIWSLSGSVSGGSDRVRYYVSGSAYDQGGIVRSFGYKRLSGRINLDYTATDRLTLGTSVALTRGLTSRARSDNTIVGPFANSIANPPWQTIYDEEGGYASTLYPNPVGLSIENEAEERSIHLFGNSFASYQLLDGVDVRASVGVDHYNLRSRAYDSPLLPFSNATRGEATVADAYVTKLVYEGTANWLRDLGAGHTLSGVVGGSYEHSVEESNEVSGQQFPNAYFRQLVSAATITDGDSELTDWSLVSYFSRLSYTYNDRYTATFNIRADGSSRFGADNRYGIFPSASLLWRAGQEEFMADQGVFSDLALRVSYGRTGNQAGIGHFASRGLYTGGTNYQDLPGVAPEQLANPELRWEATDQFNIGTDLAVLDDRLSLSLDYYIKNTTDLLFERPVPRSTGFEVIWSNVGSMENRGIELNARADLVRAAPEAFNWSINLNLSRNENEVTELFNDEPFNFGFASRAGVGQPLGAFYGYVTDGIFRSQEEVDEHAFQSDETAPGDIRFKDTNGLKNGELTGEPDGLITDADRAIIGSPWPELSGGLTNTFSYGGVELSAFLQFSHGNDIYNAMREYTDAYGLGFLDNMSARALDRWSPDNPDGTEPRAVPDDPNGNASKESDRFIEDGSYLRLKNVMLGYTFPTSVAARFGLSTLRIYVQGRNLLTFTDYSGFDPEVNTAGESTTRGTDFYTLPQARAITAGFNLGF